MKRILVTGAPGQIGSELMPVLRQDFGADNVIASAVRMPSGPADGPFERLDCTRFESIQEVFRRYEIGTVFHLAALIAHLRDHGVLATGLNFPVVPKGEEEIRIQVSADHTQSDIDDVLYAIAELFA